MLAAGGIGTYIPGSSPVHALSAQVKIILTCAFSIAAFVVHSWLGLGVLVVAFIALVLVARIPPRLLLVSLVPVWFILAFTLIVHTCDGFAAWQAASGLGAGIPAELIAAGFASGMFVCVRIALLFTCCCLLTLTTTHVQIVDAARRLLRPLRHLRVPVDDVATVISLALRFVPLLTAEFVQVKAAQRSRGASFGSGGLYARIRAWGNALVPVFVRLFVQADVLAQALDARCYGAACMQLERKRLRPCDWVVLVVGLALLVALALFG